MGGMTGLGMLHKKKHKAKSFQIGLGWNMHNYSSSKYALTDAVYEDTFQDGRHDIISN